MKLFNFKRTKEVRNLQDLPTSTGESKSCGAALSNKKILAYDKSGINLAPLFNGINLISNSCAIMPWKACNEDKELLKSTHYLNHLFDNAPITKFMAVKNVIQDVLIRGNGFMYIDRNYDTGKPERLIYLPVNTVSIYKSTDQMHLYYSSTLLGNKRIPSYNMLHFKMYSRDGLVGIGLPVFAHNTIQISDYTEQNIQSTMSDGGIVTGILTPRQTPEGVPTLKNQIKEIRQKWDEARSSSNSSTVILPADLQFTQISASAKDTALVEIRNYNLLEQARFLNISPILLGDLSHNYYNSTEEAQNEFVHHTLWPWIIMMEEELNSKLIMPSKKGYEILDIDEVAILAVNKEKQAQYLTSLVTKGIMTTNEARQTLGLPPVEGGDKLVIAYSNVLQNAISGEKEDEIDKDKNEKDTENKNEEQ